MRSQKTEVIQVQCANREQGTQKRSRTLTQGPKRLQLLFLLSFLLPVDWGEGGCPESQELCAALWGSPPPRAACPTPGQGVPFSRYRAHLGIPFPRTVSPFVDAFSWGPKQGWQGLVLVCLVGCTWLVRFSRFGSQSSSAGTSLTTGLD